MEYTMNNIEDVIEKLRKLPHFLGPLDKYPSKAISVDDKDSKGAKFIEKHFKGQRSGCYYAFLGKDISKKDADGNDVLLSENEIMNKFDKLILKSLYSGEGDILGRVARMRAKKGSIDCNPVVFYCHDNNINLEDIYVLSFATDLSSKERKNQLESPIHSYCEEHRLDGKRFALADYSSSNGENGTKEYSMETEVMSWAVLKPAAALKKYAQLDLLKQKSMGVFMAANAIHFSSSSASPDEQISTN